MGESDKSINNIDDRDGAKVKMAEVVSLPFKIDLTKVDLSVSVIYKEYPQECLPDNFKNPSGPKAKKLEIEKIDNSLYDQAAHMVAFRITRERLEAWIRALGIFYYEHYGKLEALSYLVDCYDEPNDWVAESNKAICIGLVKDTQLMYKVTLFITTGVIQAQGLHHDIFARNDFPILLSLVNAICHYEKSEISNEEAEDPDHETLLKTLEHEHMPKDQIEDLSQPENTDTCSPQVTYKDFDKLQSIFVESLTKLSETQATLMSKIEKNLSDALQKVTRSVNNLQTELDTIKSLKLKDQTVEIARLESQLKSEKAKNNTTDETLRRELKNLKHENEYLSEKLNTKNEENDQLMDDNRSLRKKTDEQFNEILSLKSQLSSMFISSRNNTKDETGRKLKNLEHENEHLSEKLSTKNEENDQLMDDNRSLRKKADDYCNEILSLKSQLSRMFTSSEKDFETSRAKDLETNAERNRKPMALLIGTSNVNGIKEDKLTSDVNVTKVTAYTLDETKDVIINSSCIPDVVVLHPLTNDVRNVSPEECAEKLKGVVEVIKKKWKDVNTIISLTTPREDNSLHKVNCEILDGIIKRDYMECPGVHISDNENMWHGYLPTIQLLNPKDKFHLSPKGTSILASNMKRAIHTVLKISTVSKGHANKYQNRFNYNQEKHFQSNNGDHYYKGNPSWNYGYQGNSYNRKFKQSPNYFR